MRAAAAAARSWGLVDDEVVVHNPGGTLVVILEDVVTTGASTIKAMPYLLRIHIPNFVFESTASNLNADNPIVDKLPFIARLDPSNGYELALELFNTSSSL